MCTALNGRFRFLVNPAPRPSPSGSNNPKRIKGKPAFFSLWNICLSGLIRAFPLFIQHANNETFQTF
ncbi:hypothetical protein FZC78_08820 [Rossellomorea vietnamensis]|uniref:Uncharacterized protein n=1 Tax=Rossellomorea vietnamensis TaxID=218284 RepID=A0A5D4NZR3_9BACI|nr:hypothetical protein FZC78_08820 [Rossellomorea vietnamensis]